MAVPVDNRGQVHEPVLEPDVGNVGTPHLVHVRDLRAPKQVGKLTEHRIGHGHAGALGCFGDAFAAADRLKSQEIQPSNNRTLKKLSDFFYVASHRQREHQ